ncbi:putative leader peptide [Lysinibacter cavernae]
MSVYLTSRRHVDLCRLRSSL